MRRVVVYIDHEALASLLRLGDGQYVVGVNADWGRMAVGVTVAGPEFEDVDPGTWPPTAPLNDYVDLNLRAKLAALCNRWDGFRDGETSADVLDVLADVLHGTFDPRIEMPSADTV